MLTETIRPNSHSPFDAQNTRDLCLKFGLSSWLRPTLQFALNSAASDYADEKAKAKIDRKAANKELRDFERTLIKAHCRLSDLSADARYFFEKYHFTGLDDSGLPVKDRKSVKASYRDAIEHHLLILSTVKLAVEQSKSTGRQQEEELGCVMVAAHQFWCSVMKREFKLDWTTQSEPLTPAAEWCEAIARIVDPGLPSSKIRTAAIKVRERSISISRLRNTPEFLLTYFQRKNSLR